MTAFKAWCRHCGYRIQWHEGRRVWRRLNSTHVDSEICEPIDLQGKGLHNPTDDPKAWRKAL